MIRIWVAVYNKNKEFIAPVAIENSELHDLQLTHENVYAVGETFDDVLRSIEAIGGDKSTITICRVHIADPSELCKLFAIAMFGGSHPKILVKTDIFTADPQPMAGSVNA